MAHRLTVPCHACGAECSAWRQCPRPGCGHDEAACAKCGGDAAAIELMRAHLEEHGEARR